MSNIHLDYAIKLAGSASNLARLAKVTPQVINNAVRRDSVSADLALAIETALGGRVTKESLVWPEVHKAA